MKDEMVKGDYLGATVKLSKFAREKRQKELQGSKLGVNEPQAAVSKPPFNPSNPAITREVGEFKMNANYIHVKYDELKMGEPIKQQINDKADKITNKINDIVKNAISEFAEQQNNSGKKLLFRFYTGTDDGLKSAAEKEGQYHSSLSASDMEKIKNAHMEKKSKISSTNAGWYISL